MKIKLPQPALVRPAPLVILRIPEQIHRPSKGQKLSSEVEVLLCLKKQADVWEAQTRRCPLPVFRCFSVNTLTDWSTFLTYVSRPTSQRPRWRTGTLHSKLLNLIFIYCNQVNPKNLGKEPRRPREYENQKLCYVAIVAVAKHTVVRLFSEVS